MEETFPASQASDVLVTGKVQPGTLIRRLLIGAAFAVTLFWSFAVILGTVSGIVEAYGDMRHGFAVNSDFPMFYSGAANVVSGEREHAYEKDFIVESIHSRWVDPESETAQELIPWLRYYNPPFYLFALAPLTLLDMHVAYAVAIAINVGLLGALLCLTGVVLKWRQPMTTLFTVMALGLIALPQSIYHGQPTIWIAVLTTAAFLVTQTGRTSVAAVLVALAAAKPHYAVAAGIPILRTKPRVFIPMAVAGATIILLPFLALGAGAFADYVSLVVGRGGDDLSNLEYSTHVLSWPGFFAALTGSVQPLASLGLSVASIGLFLIVLRGGDRYLTWSASILCALIILPHSHPQDWMLTIPMAAILLARPMASQLRWVTISLLVSGYAATNTWVIASSIAYDGGRSFYAAPIFGLALLIWCAAIPLLEARRVAPEGQEVITAKRVQSFEA